MLFNKFNQNTLINKLKNDTITDKESNQGGMKILFVLILIVGSIITFLIWLPFISSI